MPSPLPQVCPPGIAHKKWYYDQLCYKRSGASGILGGEYLRLKALFDAYFAVKEDGEVEARKVLSKVAQEKAEAWKEQGTGGRGGARKNGIVWKEQGEGTGGRGAQEKTELSGRSRG